MDTRTRILKTLFEGGKMNFRKIEGDLLDRNEGTSPNIIKRELDRLAAEHLVDRDKPKDWKWGMKIFYALTEAGITTYIPLAFDSFDKALESVRKMTEWVLSDPEKLKAMQKLLRERSLRTAIDENMPLEERIEQSIADIKAIYDPLIGSYRNIHGIVCRVLGESRPQELLVGLVPESAGGFGLEFVSRAELERLRRFAEENAKKP